GGGLRGAGSPGGLPRRAADADDREVPHRGQARDPAAVPRGSLTIPVQGPSTTPVVPGGSPIAMILCTCMMPAFAYRNTQFSVLVVVTANRSYTGDGITLRNLSCVLRLQELHLRAIASGRSTQDRFQLN